MLQASYRPTPIQRLEVEIVSYFTPYKNKNRTKIGRNTNRKDLTEANSQ